MDGNVGSISRKIVFETPPIARIGLGKSPFPTRKFSFPTSLHANLLGLTSNVEQLPVPGGGNTKRRFSNVGDAVSRKLSNTIGWRSIAVPTEEVIAQGRVLCGQYIRNRLKRSGIFNKKLGLYRLSSIVGSSSALIVREVIPGLICAGTELERLHPKLYCNIARQASLSPGGIIISSKAATGLLVAIGHELFKCDVNWGKVVSIFSVAGGLAVDCVCQGHPEYLHGLMEGMVEVFEDGLAEWIATNGGWTSLSNQCRYPVDEISYAEYASILVLFLAILFVAYLAIKFVGKFGFLS